MFLFWVMPAGGTYPYPPGKVFENIVILSKAPRRKSKAGPLTKVNLCLVYSANFGAPFLTATINWTNTTLKNFL